MGSWKGGVMVLPMYNGNVEAAGEVYVDGSAVMRGGVTIADRRASRCGAKTMPRLKTNISVESPPAGLSSYITIPVGMSPSALLDSSVLIPNSQAIPSPTTGSIRLPPAGCKGLGPNQVTSNTAIENCQYFDSSLTFEPQTDSVANPCIRALKFQAMPSPTTGSIRLPPAGCEILGPNQVTANTAIENGQNFDSSLTSKPQTDSVTNPCIRAPKYQGFTGEISQCSEDTTMDGKVVAGNPCHQSPRLDGPLNGEDVAAMQLLEEGPIGELSATEIGKATDDGYNWRKYGQKQVKGSDYPRSYYKCTHPSCQVKKKVERSLDGQIMEIIYKGSHNHTKPQPTRRSAFGSPYCLNETDSVMVPRSSWRNSHPGVKDNVSVGSMEGTSLISVVTGLSDAFCTAQWQDTNMSTGTQEISSTPESQIDGVIPDCVSFEDDDVGETESKRRKRESSLIETNSVSRVVREPRVVVQTVTEVDILEDGYRWRKYGQKVVKGNPNPRSYYKCTSPGCSVRKHIERASQDLKSVITTYEGRHNHEVPPARNNNHSSSGSHSESSSSLPPSMMLPASLGIPKRELHGLDLAPCFDRKPELGRNYLRSGYVGSFTRDSNIGMSSSYGMKLPMTYNSFGLNNSNIDAYQVVPISKMMQDFPLSFAMGGVQRPTFSVPSYDLNQERPIGSELQSFLGQQVKDASMRFMTMPKQEQLNAVYDSQVNTL